MQIEKAKHQKEMDGCTQKYQQELLDLTKRLEMERLLRDSLERRLQEVDVSVQQKDKIEICKLQEELSFLRHDLKDQLIQKQQLEEEVKNLKQQNMQANVEADETRKTLEPKKTIFCLESTMSIHKPNHMREVVNGQRATIAKLFEQVGLQKIFSFLESEDMDVRVHAVKVLANLAAEEANQEKIVEAGGLSSLLSLLKSSEDETIRRVAAGAIANLAMNETNQELIMIHGGIKLLATTANEAEDPQTLRMVAGAIANLCGNEKLQSSLREEGGIKALLGMVRSKHPDVLAQIARGIANLAKCESRGAAQGQNGGRSLLIDDGALPWMVANANSEASPIRRHIELALCHLAQHEANAKDLVAAGALLELVRISRECSREDIRNLAKRTLSLSLIYQAALTSLHIGLG